MLNDYIENAQQLDYQAIADSLPHLDEVATGNVYLTVKEVTRDFTTNFESRDEVPIAIIKSIVDTHPLLQEDQIIPLDTHYYQPISNKSLYSQVNNFILINPKKTVFALSFVISEAALLYLGYSPSIVSSAVFATISTLGYSRLIKKNESIDNETDDLVVIDKTNTMNPAMRKNSNDFSIEQAKENDLFKMTEDEQSMKGSVEEDSTHISNFKISDISNNLSGFYLNGTTVNKYIFIGAYLLCENENIAENLIPLVRVVLEKGFNLSDDQIEIVLSLRFYELDSEKFDEIKEILGDAENFKSAEKVLSKKDEYIKYLEIIKFINK